MIKYKITMEVETFAEPHQLDNSSFQYMFMHDLKSFLEDGIGVENGFDGVDNNFLALTDGELRHFSTKFHLQEIETEEKEVPVDPAIFA